VREGERWRGGKKGRKADGRTNQVNEVKYDHKMVPKQFFFFSFCNTDAVFKHYSYSIDFPANSSKNSNLVNIHQKARKRITIYTQNVNDKYRIKTVLLFCPFRFIFFIFNMTVALTTALVISFYYVIFPRFTTVLQSTFTDVRPIKIL